MSATSKVSNVFQYADVILTLLEKLSEPSFYESLLGERLANLLKRHVGNDLVILSLVFYVSRIIRTKVTLLFAQYFQKKKKETLVVSVQVRSTEFELYQAVAFTVRKHQSKAENLNMNKLIAAYDRDPYYALDEEEEFDLEIDKQVMAANSRVVQFYPPDGKSNDVFFKGRRVTVVHHAKGKRENDTDWDETSGLTGNYWEITIEGDSLEDLKELVKEWAYIYSNRGSKVAQQMTSVFRAMPCDRWMHSQPIKTRQWESVSIKGDLKEKLLQDIRMFKSRQNWYTTRGIPHRRGYLLHGPPGTGKTSLIRAIAGELKMNLGILNVADMTSDANFTSLMEDSPPDTIVVLEDFDRHMSLDNSDNWNVSLACLLNVLDGINSPAGTIIFMTCNHIERIDRAILRPGRMDVKLHLDYADRKQVEDIFWRFFGLDYETLAPVTGERKAYLQSVQKKFADMIPPMKVSPAELESHFITVILAGDAISLDEDAMFDSIFKETPSFLEKIEQTRAGLGITSFSDKAEATQDPVDKSSYQGEDIGN